MKTFDLKPILAAMKRYTDQVRFMTLDMYQDARRHEDEFSNSLYSVVRTHFDKVNPPACPCCCRPVPPRAAAGLNSKPDR